MWFKMKFLSVLFKTKTQKSVKTIAEYQQDMLIRQGREQFKKLMDKGLHVPVALL
jgi:hypothetical protein